jgi:hypothetical protein
MIRLRFLIRPLRLPLFPLPLAPVPPLVPPCFFGTRLPSLRVTPKIYPEDSLCYDS